MITDIPIFKMVNYISAYLLYMVTSFLIYVANYFLVGAIFSLIGIDKSITVYLAIVLTIIPTLVLFFNYYYLIKEGEFNFYSKFIKQVYYGLKRNKRLFKYTPLSIYTFILMLSAYTSPNIILFIWSIEMISITLFIIVNIIYFGVYHEVYSIKENYKLIRAQYSNIGDFLQIFMLVNFVMLLIVFGYYKFLLFSAMPITLVFIKILRSET